MVIALIVLTEVYLGVKIVETLLKLYDRFEMNKVAKDLAKQLEEEEAMFNEQERCKGKHSIN